MTTSISDSHVGLFTIMSDEGELINLVTTDLSDRHRNVFHWCATTSFGEVVLDHAQDDTFSIWRMVIRSKRTVSLRFSHPRRSYCGLIFGLSNDVSLQLVDLEFPLLREYQYNLIYLPTLSADIVLSDHDEHQIAGIALDPAFLIHSVRDYLSPMPSYMMNVTSRRSAIFTTKNRFFTPHAVSIAQELLKALSDKVVPKLFLHSRALYILETTLRSPEPDREKHIQMDKSDAECVRKAMLYIRRHVNKRITLRDVAIQFHTNEKTVSKGFKLMYGIEFSSYVLRLRMQRAHEYLRSGKSVKETAHLSGYGSPSNFSTIFKKTFGYTPAHLIRRG
jgi:AraC-like DNA-binding protein